MALLGGLLLVALLGMGRQYGFLAAFLSEKDDGGRMLSYNRVGLVAVVGNEDGAHHVTAELYQALNDVGFALAPNAVSYWVGKRCPQSIFRDLTDVPEAVTAAMLWRREMQFI
jgi:hypothetical protein